MDFELRKLSYIEYSTFYIQIKWAKKTMNFNVNNKDFKGLRYKLSQSEIHEILQNKKMDFNGDLLLLSGEVDIKSQDV